MVQAFKASIIIPCFNEETTLRVCVERVLAIADARLALEIIIVDDGSTDGSVAVAEYLQDAHQGVRLLEQPSNRGKGAALCAGIAVATGDVIAVQDADLEYDPQDLRNLIELIRLDRADVVFGSRFISSGAHRVLYFWHWLGNRMLTFISNVFTDLNLSDVESCYKVFRRDIIQGIDLRELRFGIEPEIVAKVARLRPRIFEMGISYAGRTYEEGKKIGARDGVRALYCILRYNPWRPTVFLLLLLGILVVSFCLATAIMVLSHCSLFTSDYGSPLQPKT